MSELEALFLLAKRQEGTEAQYRTLCKIISDHRGLAGALKGCCVRDKTWQEALTMMWIALPKAIREWDPAKASATTFWRACLQEASGLERDQTTFVDSVRMYPKRARKLRKKVPIFFNDAVERILTQWGHYDKERKKPKEKGKA